MVGRLFINSNNRLFMIYTQALESDKLQLGIYKLKYFRNPKHKTSGGIRLLKNDPQAHFKPALFTEQIILPPFRYLGISCHSHLIVQVNLDMTDSMGPGKLVRHMQNPSYTYDEYLICIGLGPSISSIICKNLSYSGPSYPSSPVIHCIDSCYCDSMEVLMEITCIYFTEIHICFMVI